MKAGDMIAFIPPIGKQAGRKVVGHIVQAATDSNSLVTVKGLDGMPYQFDAWLVKWEIIADAPSPNN